MRTRLFRVTAVLDVVTAAVGSAAAQRIRPLTKSVLMPALAFSALRGARSAPKVERRVTRSVISGVALSWCGDVALLRKDETAFIVGLGSFLCGHLSYGAGFSAVGGAAGLKAQPLLAAPALAVAGVGAAALLPVAGGLHAPVAGYIAVIAGMAALAAGTRRPAAVAGAALFCVSDLLLGLSRFRTLPVPGPVVDAVVMATYCAAQESIVRSLLDTSSISVGRAGHRRR